jgi:hypothetical protein
MNKKYRWLLLLSIAVLSGGVICAAAEEEGVCDLLGSQYGLVTLYDGTQIEGVQCRYLPSVICARLHSDEDRRKVLVHNTAAVYIATIDDEEAFKMLKWDLDKQLTRLMPDECERGCAVVKAIVMMQLKNSLQ